jgi:hypothetical protein
MHTNNNNNSNAYTGFITKKERKQGIDILELEHV